jgi:two-component sensor histidine kinase
VAHRAKNALHLVGAAVRMTRATDTAEFVRLVEGRVAALARAQTLLAEAGGRGADLRALAAGEIASVLAEEEDGPRVDFDGPALELAEDAVQPFSMALHELATNAAKYGALSRAAGRIALSWGLDEEAGLLRLRWEERGGPPPPGPPEREGFGSRVLEATLVGQLGGTVQRDWPATGMVLRASLSLDRIAAAS